jgi:hypothetical protein
MLNKIECQKLYDQGFSLKEIAEKFGTYKLKIQRLGLDIRTSHESREFRNNHKLTTEQKKKLSLIAIKRGFGGTNRRKTFLYKNVILESSYELKVAKELDNNGILWERPKRFHWIDNFGIKHHYTPDFYLLDYDLYLDPKNDYLIKKDKDKIERVQNQNNIKIFVIDKYHLTWKDISVIIGKS